MSPKAPGEAARSELFEGGYYSIMDGETFAVARVLKIDLEIVHVRIYKERFPQRPRSIDPARLTLATIDDEDGFVMDHLPLSTAAFQSRKLLFMTHSAVTTDELEAYQMWKDAGGGVWE